MLSRVADSLYWMSRYIERAEHTARLIAVKLVSMVEQTPDDAAATYLFNKHVIKHRFCPTCGIHPYGEGTDPKGRAMAAINLRCIEDLDLEAIPVQHYDGRAA